MKKLAVISLLIVVALSLQLYRQQMRITALEKRAESEKKSGSDTKPTASLEYQGKCAEQAARFYKEGRFKNDDYHSFENHYSPILNKCFIKVIAMDENPGRTFVTSRVIYDAYEGKEYAQYIWESDKKKKYWEVPPIICNVTLADGPPTRCNSDKEFDELIKSYMQN